MAWEDFERGAVRGITGDDPFDGMRAAAKGIRRIYLERLGRRPYFAELLRALRAAVAADPPAFVADTALPAFERPAAPAGRSDTAWEEFQDGAVRGVTGDRPIGEMSSALRRIRRRYVERFGRNPYFAELLYALRGALLADPPADVEDQTLPTLEQLVEVVGADTAFEHIDPGYYEGAIDEETGDFLVFPLAAPDKPWTRDSMVLRGQVVEEGEKSVLCPYTILSPSIADGMARSLIRQCVLQDLLDYDVIDGGLTIRFERTA
jgi:hypothetical protein